VHECLHMLSVLLLVPVLEQMFSPFITLALKKKKKKNLWCLTGIYWLMLLSLSLLVLACVCVGILEFCPEGIVRVGSRCKDTRLEEFNIKNIRRKLRQDRKVGGTCGCVQVCVCVCHNFI
jgi:hypothetical protein